MNNRKHNAHNPNQGDFKKILCVCSAGLLRSPTLAFVLSNEGYNTRAVGSSQTFALIPIDDVHVHWADEIVFVNKENYQEAKSIVNLEGKRVFVLDIPDIYPFRHERLQEICLDQYKQQKENHV